MKWTLSTDDKKRHAKSPEGAHNTCETIEYESQNQHKCKNESISVEDNLESVRII